MKFSTFSVYLQKLESTSSRNAMTETLAQLFQKACLADIDKVCYLSLGRLGPLYKNVEFGISDKLMMRVIAQAFGKSVEKIKKEYRKKGDLGEVAADIGRQRTGHKRQILENRKQRAEKRGLTVEQVFEKLYTVAVDAGEGSQKRKIKGLAELIWQLDPVSAKYLVRIPLGKLRLGFSDVTVLDALSWMLKGDKSARPAIEQAYFVSTDIGQLARLIKEEGLLVLRKVKIKVGVPIKPALSERLASARAIVEKLGKFAVEPKMDGFRVQVHVKRGQKAENGRGFLKTEGGKQEKTNWSFALSSQPALFKDFGINPNVFVRIFSRNLEDTTVMFPEIVRAVQQLPAESAILDGEAIAYDPVSHRFLPFQETVQRKRKHGVAKAAKDVPLKVFVFDLLYLNGSSLLHEPFKVRRAKLERLIRPLKTANSQAAVINLVEQKVVNTTKQLHGLFGLYTGQSLEGVMCKKLDAVYQAGARNFNWVKFKRATEGTGLADTIDVVVMGYYAGRGQRTQFGLGAFLVGVREKKDGTFRTLAKIGTGLTEAQWQQIYQYLQPLKTEKKPPQYVVHKNLQPDQWVVPALVVEIKADEITRSPVHSAYADIAEVVSGTRAEIAGVLGGTSAGIVSSTRAKIKKSRAKSAPKKTGNVGIGSQDAAKSAPKKTGNVGIGLALRFPRLVSFRSDKSPQDATTVTEVARLYKMQTSSGSNL